MQQAGSVAVQVKADLAPFERGLRQAEQEARRFDRGSQRTFQAGKRALDNLNASAIGASRGAKGLSDSLRNTASSVAVLDGPLGGVASRFSAVATLTSRAGIALGGLSLGIGAATYAARQAVRAFSQLETQQRTIEAVIRATGGAAGRTAGQIEELAQSLARDTLAGTQNVRAAAAQLLTFKSIASDVFDETLRLAQDLSAVGFGSLEQSAVQLAKALEDPAQGLAALRRVGVSFSAQQQQLIKDLNDSGRQLEAQREILKTVRAQVGGAGAAAGGGLAGAYDSLSVEMGIATERMGEQIVRLTQWEAIVRRIAGLIGSVNQGASRDAQMADLRARIQIASDAFGARSRMIEELRELERQALAESLEGRAAQIRADRAAQGAAQERVTTVVSGINQEIEANRRSELQNAIIEAQRKAGVSAASAEGQAIADLVTQLHQEKAAKEAGAKASEEAARQREQEAIQIAGVIDALQFELALIGRSSAEQRAMIEARAAGAAATAEQREQIYGLVFAIERERDAIEEAAEMQRFFNDIAYQGFADLIPQIDTGVAALDRLIERLIEAVLQAALLGSGPFGSLFGGGLFGGLGFARGGVFSGGEVIPFARGGVVSRPTVFPMARGAGLMGEAGPEAIMPLRRDSSGRLGVIVANENRQGGDAGGQVINFAPVTNIDARGASPGTAAALRQELDKRDRALLKQVQGVVSVGMRRGDIR